MCSNINLGYGQRSELFPVILTGKKKYRFSRADLKVENTIATTLSRDDAIFRTNEQVRPI